ncbi:MAG: molybdopterin molybdotransferase MoeA [Gammaproteobacteria bacterium]|nr:molybdopterin molybdotransferase MoeA [Gammaproteobacteria bacterium]
MSQCCDTPKQNLISFDDAIELLLSKARAIPGKESVPLDQALGRVLATAVESGINVPPHDNSAMDGYAVRCADVSTDSTTLPVSQRIPAGSIGTDLEPGTAARIFTGAPVPPGADAVVMQEYCQQQDDQVVIGVAPKSGANIRRAGEDITAGAIILEPGTLLRPQELGLAASVGVAELEVVRRLRVALFATGDELVDPGQALAPGQIYNSNRYTLAGLLRSAGCEVIDLGRVADTLDDTREALLSAAQSADLIISSGGVSVGEEDYVKLALEQLGQLDMWRIAMKPGKPVAYGRIGETDFIGLPGNPVSVFVTFLLFARPFINTMQGLNKVLPTGIPVKAGFDWPRPDKRREFVRARLVPDGSAELYPQQGSGVLSSAAWADGLVVIRENQVIKPGDPVTYFSFRELF